MMTTNTMVHRAKLHLVEAATIQHLAQQYGSPFEVLCELVDNGIDAGACNVWVTIEESRVLVIDDGHGMVPEMSVEDRGLFKLFLDEAEHGGVDPDDDVRELISPQGLSSLEWMMNSVGFSSKVLDESGRIRGTKGIGALAVRQIANRASWTTRPCRELADREVDSVFVLHPPTTKQLARHDLEYKIEERQKALCDPYGKKLVSGTQVELREIHSFAMDQLRRVSALVSFLNRRFGAEVLTKELNLCVVDRVTRDGKHKAGGREIVIKPIRYKGFPVLEDTFYLPGGRMPFAVRIVYNPNGTNPVPVMLRRKGSDVLPLAELPEFNTEPWTTPGMTGYVEFPSVLDKVAPWTANKKTPLESKVKSQWIKAVVKLCDPIFEKIQELRNKQNERHEIDLARDLAAAALEAVKEVSSFEDLMFTQIRGRRGKKLEAGKPTAVEVVRAACLNENNDGVAGVTIEVRVYPSKELVARKVSQKSGYLSFGKLEPGQYLIRVVGVPKRVKPQHGLERLFRISNDKKGHREVFRFLAGEKPREHHRLERLDIWMRPLPDPMQPYDTNNLDDGVLVINTDCDDYRATRESGDSEKRYALCAQYVAAALTEYGLEGDPDYLLQQSSLLFPKIYDHLRAFRAKRRKKKSR